MEGEMAKQSADQERLIDRRTVLQAGVGLVTAGPKLLSGENAEAQTRPKVIIDSQVHAYAANTPERPWVRVPNWPAHVYRPRDGGGDEQGWGRRRDLHLAVLDVQVRRQLRRRGTKGESRQVRDRQAS